MLALVNISQEQREKRHDEPLQTYGITPQSARDFCRRQGFAGVAAWAAQHGCGKQAVSRALSEKTPGRRSQDLYNLLIEAMRDEPAHLHRQLAALRATLGGIQNQVRDFSTRITRLEKQLPPWM
jgi:hypothetical protein